MVLKIFAAIGGLVKVRSAHSEIDTHVFRLHYRWTTSLCFIACALVAASEFIGDPIQCMKGTDAAEKPINTYCWIASTFTINTTADSGEISNLGNRKGDYREETLHAYYQWVPFVLFFQGCLFYLPHLLWKCKEGKTVDTLLQGLNHNSLDKDIDKKKENIIKYLKESKGRNGQYSVVYFMCEIVNLFNVLGQMWLLDVFLGGNFMKFGIKALSFAMEDSEYDPFHRVFPKVTKCTFYKYGASGTLQAFHPLCVLPQNILNEKVFFILWMWFVILATITSMGLVWRLSMFFSPIIRVRLFKRRGKIDYDDKFEKSVQRLHLGDYFLLDLLGKNLDALTFKDILKGAVIGQDANGNNAPYRPLGALDDDDDDPIDLKRRMEVNDGDAV